ncbi:PDZ and LIM domain protein Zasp [Eumeta japonica]|uniref:PDZ and LIM domain protein Zasp n=1 Tax=Eumeta variegata TaxID=151549 RepID=A0A4C1Z3T2_EUMVA|nr:PDZ and LIM domain protein Zasp [Eumeta japonica]
MHTTEISVQRGKQPSGSDAVADVTRRRTLRLERFALIISHLLNDFRWEQIVRGPLPHSDTDASEPAGRTRSRRRAMAAVSEISLRQAAGSPLGFRLTGGSKFSMPLTVFEVSEGSRAHRAGVRPGDVLLRINGADAAGLSLSDAHRIIAAAGDNVRLSISKCSSCVLSSAYRCSLDDQELTENEELIKASVLSANEDTDSDNITSVSSERDTSEVQEEIDHEDLSQNIETSIVKVSATQNELNVKETSENRENKTNFITSDSLGIDNNIRTAFKIKNDNTVVNNTTPEQEKSNSENLLNITSTRSSINSNKEVISCSSPMATSQDQFEDEEYVDVRSLPLRPPQPAPKPEKAQRRCWHPVMWETSPPPDADAEEELPPEEAKHREYPHKQRIRNLRRLMAEGKVKAEPETLIFFLCNKFAVSEERKNKIA